MDLILPQTYLPLLYLCRDLRYRQQGHFVQMIMPPVACKDDFQLLEESKTDITF